MPAWSFSIGKSPDSLSPTPLVLDGVLFPLAMETLRDRGAFDHTTLPFSRRELRDLSFRVRYHRGIL